MRFSSMFNTRKLDVRPCVQCRKGLIAQDVHRNHFLSDLQKAYDIHVLSLEKASRAAINSVLIDLVAFGGRSWKQLHMARMDGPSASLFLQTYVTSPRKSSNTVCRPFNCSGNRRIPVLMGPDIHHAFTRNVVPIAFKGNNGKRGVTMLQAVKSDIRKMNIEPCIPVHRVSSFRTLARHQIKCELHSGQETVENLKNIPPLPDVAGEAEDLSRLSLQSHGDGVMDPKIVLQEDNGGGQGGFGGGENGNLGGGGGGDDGGEEDGYDVEDEFEPILNAEQVFKEVNARGAVLPSDMVNAAMSQGISKLLLFRYLDLQEAGWPLGMAIRVSPAFRNRMLADPSFLFKILTEIAIESVCATFAEVQKRGKDFWREFELYLADLLVGIVVCIALVSMSAPIVRFGQSNVSFGLGGQIQHAIRSLPSSVFEAERAGSKFSIEQRIGTYFYKGVQYGAVGLLCGIIGQGMANSIMILKRKLKKSEEKSIPVPPLLQTAALWGAFLAVSSNTRYQIVNGLEAVVEGSTLAKKVPPIAFAFTIGIRFANNVYAGMQFVDWARWAGVQ